MNKLQEICLNSNKSKNLRNLSKTKTASNYTEKINNCLKVNNILRIT